MAKKMTTKKPVRVLGESTPICKEPGCLDATASKGYCRLHLLKFLKNRLSAKTKKSTNVTALVPRNRRKNRAQKLGENLDMQPDEMGQEALQKYGEIDIDIDSVDIETLENAPSPLKKTGS